jgi:hypothetical protein
MPAGVVQYQDDPLLFPYALFCGKGVEHEEAERRALAGELAELEARWREAEEIARIADGL